MTMMLNSLRLRLILMFMLVVMVAVGTVLFASQATSYDLQAYNNVKNDQLIISTLLGAYNHGQSQHALQALTEQLARSSHQRIILYNHQMVVIADSDRKLIGQVLKLPTTALGISSPISTTLYISTDMMPPDQGLLLKTFPGGSPEANFLTSVDHSLWLAVLIAGLTALLLAVVFSHTILKPIRSLKAAASRMERGDLSQRVSIKARGEIGALAHAFNTMADGPRPGTQPDQRRD